MSHRNKQNILKICTDELTAQIAFGESKHCDKVNGQSTILTEGKIYSYQTFHTYMSIIARMLREGKSSGERLKSLDDVRRYAPAWLQGKVDSDLSAYSVRTYAAALAKLLHCPSSAFGVVFPERQRKNIKRSRRDTVRDKHINLSCPEYADLLLVLRCCGLRRKEVTALAFYPEQTIKNKNGKWYLHLNKGTKGGKARDVEICGSPEEIRRVIEIISSTPTGQRVFAHVSRNVDIHAIRREYAQRLYAQYAQPTESPNMQFERIILYHNHIVGRYFSSNRFHSDPERAKQFYRWENGKPYLLPGYRDVSRRYYIRGTDGHTARCFDRLAMLKVSQSLGHNRECVTVCYLI